MRNQALIAETDYLLAQLSEEKLRSVRDFVAFLAQQPMVNVQAVPEETEEEFRADIAVLQQHSAAFDFLHDEPDLYSDDDLVEHYQPSKPS